MKNQQADYINPCDSMTFSESTPLNQVSSQASSNETIVASKAATKAAYNTAKLPCRGCLSSCQNFIKCQQKPIWR